MVGKSVYYTTSKRASRGVSTMFKPLKINLSQPSLAARQDVILRLPRSSPQARFSRGDYLLSACCYLKSSRKRARKFCESVSTCSSEIQKVLMRRFLTPPKYACWANVFTQRTRSTPSTLAMKGGSLGSLPFSIAIE